MRQQRTNSARGRLPTQAAVSPAGNPFVYQGASPGNVGTPIDQRRLVGITQINAHAIQLDVGGSITGLADGMTFRLWDNLGGVFDSNFVQVTTGGQIRFAFAGDFVSAVPLTGAIIDPQTIVTALFLSNVATFVPS